MDIDTLILYYTVKKEAEEKARSDGIEVEIGEDNIKEVYREKKED